MSFSNPQEPPAAPAVTVTPPVETPPTPPPPAPPVAPATTGPWAKDLAAAFTDDGVRGQVDEFLRSNVQPYVTGLETKATDLRAAGELLEALQEDPEGTYVALSRQLWGDEAIDDIQRAIGLGEAPPAPEVTEAPEYAPIDPRVQAIIDREEAAAAQKDYDAAIVKLKADRSDESVTGDLLAPFVVAEDGDIDQAYTRYLEWKGQIAPGAAVTPADVPPPPATIGSSSAAPTTPPVEPRYGSLDDAIDSFMAEQQAAPTTVGSV